MVLDIFLTLLIELDFQVFILLLEQFENAFLVLELVLKAFSDLLKLFNVILHVLEEILLLLLLLFLVSGLFGFLHRHVLLELIEQGGELLFQTVVLMT